MDIQAHRLHMAGNFSRLDCIGSGSFGKVWLVEYTTNRRKYVLKEIKVAGMSEKEIEQAVTEVRERERERERERDRWICFRAVMLKMAVSCRLEY